jgi:DNA-binding NarL/FixJ family response regulator
MRVLLIDDSPTFLQAIASLVRAWSDVELVSVASSGEEGLARAAEVRPDLVLVDVVMPGLDGFETTRRLKALPTPARVVVVSLSDQPPYYKAAIEAGADGFVAKGDLPRALGDLLRRNEDPKGD